MGNGSQDLALSEPVPETQGESIWPEASGRIIATDNATNLFNGEGVRQPTKNHRPDLHYLNFWPCQEKLLNSSLPCSFNSQSSRRLNLRPFPNLDMSEDAQNCTTIRIPWKESLF